MGCTNSEKASMKKYDLFLASQNKGTWSDVTAHISVLGHETATFKNNF